MPHPTSSPNSDNTPQIWVRQQPHVQSHRLQIIYFRYTLVPKPRSSILAASQSPCQLVQQAPTPNRVGLPIRAKTPGFLPKIETLSFLCCLIVLRRVREVMRRNFTPNCPIVCRYGRRPCSADSPPTPFAPVCWALQFQRLQNTSAGSLWRILSRIRCLVLGGAVSCPVRLQQAGDSCQARADPLECETGLSSIKSNRKVYIMVQLKHI